MRKCDGKKRGKENIYRLGTASREKDRCCWAPWTSPPQLPMKKVKCCLIPIEMCKKGEIFEKKAHFWSIWRPRRGLDRRPRRIRRNSCRPTCRDSKRRTRPRPSSFRCGRGARRCRRWWSALGIQTRKEKILHTVLMRKSAWEEEKCGRGGERVILAASRWDRRFSR